ncbi:MAG: efflux RND transporter periplasmic adaptor subunit [Bacteroidota bacterium]|jgi:HlyD family secretion protein|nr:efflux RND transporter periplasmic adaptor subunit [Ignavibacteria bacterium]MCU7498978.1 efflux RND transporter periplasmic adaptor subunit [Ignavibacteria bacterium]MCU7512447.1 efflux RND transporter periplasmic adaptor subunit [Ignavibacteria bacterium]MCU7518582.1 efflux RND transporter periplasmic adaptor subunit [Ignavibacteria bacterium]MCU7524266.1 efflux RND transporter periplasmic adaptor subunit [Ignavibacteria bacterium]
MANGNKKKSRKKIYIFSGIGLMVTVLVLLLVFSGNKEQIIPVQTESVQKRNITQRVSATGKINPEYQVIITPEVTGEIVELPVKEGDIVRKGQLLIKIKPDTYMAARDRAAATLESAKAGLQRSKAVLDKVAADYKRIQELYRKKLSSDAELEQSKSNFLSAQSDFDSQKSSVAQFQAALKEAQENLYKTTIYSPMNGTISQLNVELGERVLGSGFSQGTNIMTVADLSKMEATVEVDENDVVLVSLGDTAKIQIDAFGNKEFKGVVSQIGNSAKTTAEGTQQEVVNFEIKIRLTDTDNSIRPGMSCNSDIETETKNNVLSVPIQSVTARGNKAPEVKKEGEDSGPIQVKNDKIKDKKPKEVVFVIENNKAKMKEVKTGISDDNYIEIISGLTGNEKVVSGSYRAISRELAENSNVRVEGAGKGAK